MSALNRLFDMPAKELLPGTGSICERCWHYKLMSVPGGPKEKFCMADNPALTFQGNEHVSVTLCNKLRNKRSKRN